MKSLNKAKLLLVDDDASMVRLLTEVVDMSFGRQIELHASTDPAEARGLIETDLIDILVTDLEMPGISGLSLLRCAKRRNPLTQVLLLTGHSSAEALIDALEMGATDYLLKPFDHVELVVLLEQAEKRVRRWRQSLAGTLGSRGKRVPATVL